MSGKYHIVDGKLQHVDTGLPPPDGNHKFKQYTDGTLELLVEGDAPQAKPGKPQPVLLDASTLPPFAMTSEALSNAFCFAPDTARMQRSMLAITGAGKAVEWLNTASVCWVQVPCEQRLYGGSFLVEFNVEKLMQGQIGVGFLLDWSLVGPDWGFYGYLGSSHTAWSFDPSTGDIVSGTESITQPAGSLPTFAGGTGGTIGIEFHLPVGAEGHARFVIDSVKLDDKHNIALPPSAVVVPACCLLKKGQKITITRCDKL